MIIKRIYFSDDVYKRNEKEFTKMLGVHEISWYKPAEKMYVNDRKIKLLSGIYISKDQNKKIFAFFEGNEKPATMIVKISSGGGNFLIDINSFCHNAGCTIEDKDEKYLNGILLRLKEFGDIDIKERGHGKDYGKGYENKKLTDFKTDVSSFKLRRIVRSRLRRYLTDYGKSLLNRGISIKVASNFKKRFLEEDVKWAMENGWVVSR